MKSMEVIRQRLLRVLKIEQSITERERDEFKQKKHDEESYYGIGGNYSRYEKCQQKREDHLRELKRLEKNLETYRPTDELKLYPWFCPTCRMRIFLESSASRGVNEVVDCPVCSRTIFRAAKSTTWEIIRGSEASKT